MKICKYCLGGNYLDTSVELLYNANILSAQNQHELLCLWVAFDEKETRIEKRKIKILYTGISEKINPHHVFINTVQFRGGNLIVHVFEEIEGNS